MAGVARDGPTYFMVSKCPLDHECNPKNFANWKVWGKTEDECRAQLMRHLKESGLHAACEEEDGDRSDMYGNIVAAAEVQEVLWDQPKKGTKRAVSPPAQRPSHPPPRSSTPPVGGLSLIPMSRMQIKELAEAAARAQKAAQNAARLSAAAASAFSDEAAAFQDIQTFALAKLSASSSNAIIAKRSLTM